MARARFRARSAEGRLWFSILLHAPRMASMSDCSNGNVGGPDSRGGLTTFAGLVVIQSRSRQNRKKTRSVSSSLRWLDGFMGLWPSRPVRDARNFVSVSTVTRSACLAPAVSQNWQSAPIVAW
jgi:hypothetical protein